MPTDEERFRFLNTFKISETWSNEGCSLYFRGEDEPGKPGGYFPIAKGKDLIEATDRAIERWERKV